MTNIDRAILSFQGEQIAICGPLSHEEVVQRLSATGKRFSADVLDLYCRTGGMKDGAISRTGISIWPVPYLVFENSNDEAPDLAFADYLLDCWRYYFHYESETRSSVYGGLHGRKLADSVEEFFGKYLADPGCLDLNAV